MGLARRLTSTGTADPRLESALAAPRIVIDAPEPCVDRGRYPARAIVNQPITISANIFSDGHDRLGAQLLWQGAGARDRQRVPLRLLGNDRWQAEITPPATGLLHFTIEAWFDRWESWRHDAEAKRAAGHPIALEFEEGRALLAAAAARASASLAQDAEALLRQLEGLDALQGLTVLLGDEAARIMAAAGERPFLVRYEPPLAIEVEREKAGFASWYELFPRSQASTAGEHGTLDDVIQRLPRLREMGFDVLYLPPIHPIGMQHRKGRNNALQAAPDDPGSPWAIGGKEGGHTAVHPQLGGIEAFRRLRAAAEQQGIELALDFALQCSRDHPWLTEHPEWFSWRPDGSIRFAENPPKKYEDIVNFDFYAGGDKAASQALWRALRDVLRYWIGEGVRIFRVDNPHTKPLPFWEWVIAEIRNAHPDVIFLSEAFTRPALMYRLAKIGFSQSYTYFTWRDTRQELTRYMLELTREAPKDFFRPQFFVNTPDINPFYLQTSGRAGFLIRAALASTLSGLWGMYSGFELCEAAPLPGREEYLDSEKYELRQRDWHAPGNIAAEIARLNRIRRANPALHTHLGLEFYASGNDQVICYGKHTRDCTNFILAAVSLDPRNAQEAWLEVPLREFGLPDHGALQAEELMWGDKLTWHGKIQHWRFHPQRPFAIWRLAPAA